jgi:putative transcriptional regulator
MAADGGDDGTNVLQSKRDATRYQILVQIAERQPAVSQQEVADAIGITSQAVSDYLQDLVSQGYVDKQGRGRYEVTKEGVDWLISQTERLREYVEHVSTDVIGQVDVEAALATAPIEPGQPVTLSMHDGTLHATPGSAGSATAVAITEATEAEDVGVTDFEGVLDYDLGDVTVLSLPRVDDGGSRAVDAETVERLAADHDLLATVGIEALAAARRADLEPDLRFGTPDAVAAAATRGLDVVLLAVTTELAAHTERLREANVSYELVDATE